MITITEEMLAEAAAWAEGQEDIILQTGVPLTAAQRIIAVEQGVRNPDRVHLKRVGVIPAPEGPLGDVARAINLITPMTVGLTLRYGIYIREDYWDDRETVAHELTHVRQYEDLGGIIQFLRQYLHECSTVGYPGAPMEQEAINSAKRFGWSPVHP
jgi:hypothetical protein